MDCVSFWDGGPPELQIHCYSLVNGFCICFWCIGADLWACVLLFYKTLQEALKVSEKLQVGSKLFLNVGRFALISNRFQSKTPSSQIKHFDSSQNFLRNFYDIAYISKKDSYDYFDADDNFYPLTLSKGHRSNQKEMSKINLPGNKKKK